MSRSSGSARSTHNLKKSNSIQSLEDAGPNSEVSSLLRTNFTIASSPGWIGDNMQENTIAEEIDAQMKRQTLRWKGMQKERI